jgi:hypothetical protein
MSTLRVGQTETRPFFTVKALGAYLSLSERTVRQLLAERAIEGVRLSV